MILTASTIYDIIIKLNLLLHVTYNLFLYYCVSRSLKCRFNQYHIIFLCFLQTTVSYCVSRSTTIKNTHLNKKQKIKNNQQQQKQRRRRRETSQASVYHWILMANENNMNGEEQHPPPSNDTLPSNDQRGPKSGVQQHPQQHPPQHNHHGLRNEEPNQQHLDSSTDGELQEARGKKGKTLKTKKTTSKLKGKTTNHEMLKKALSDSYANCSAKETCPELVENVWNSGD